MATAISITPANVIAGANARYTTGTAGATITAGMALFSDSADLQQYKGCDNTSAAKAACVGIALCGAADGQPIELQTSGTITIGGTVAVGTVYCVGDAAGGGTICTLADLGTGEFVTTIGVGVSATEIAINIQATGVAHA